MKYTIEYWLQINDEYEDRCEVVEAVSSTNAFKKVLALHPRAKKLKVI